MKKVYARLRLNEEQKRRLESISDQYQFVYEAQEDINILIGSCSPARLRQFKNLEWLQSSAVGVDAYMKKGVLPENCILTNAVGVHSREVAEHILAELLMMVKKLHRYGNNQKKHIWRDEGQVKQISELRVCIVGFGDIGRTLAEMLKALGVHVIGVKRKPIEKPDCLDELYLEEDLEKAISDADVIVTVLPGNKANVHLFTADTFRKMRPDAILINAGRGSLFSTETLREVLDQHIIAGIGADVFEQEPLPADSDLWDEEELFITPHAAGNYHLDSAYEEFLQLVEENLRRYAAGEPLLHVVTERE